MRKTLLTSVAAVALVAGSTLGFAQGMNKGGEAPAAAPSAGAPSSSAPAEKSAPTTRGQGAEHQAPSGSMKGGQAEQKMPRANDSAQRDHEMKTKGAESESKSGGKSASETSHDKSKTDMKADTKNGADKNAAENKSDTKASTTTGQAGASAKLTSEQRTKITTVIHKQNVKPVTKVNFSISVGTHVPRTVTFHPVPTEIVTIYPSWRGYEFFLVRDEIVIVNPRTLEIVAVLPA